MANTHSESKSDETKVVETVAVFVCHGMGQQVPFETIDSVALALRKTVEKENEYTGTHPPKITVNIVSFPESERPLPRAELQFEAADGTARAVHIYEAYWAPLTEGKVSLRDVVSFLISAGFFGLLRACFNPFRRWMFGDWKNFGYSCSAPFSLLLALLVVLSLIVMNSTILTVAAARVVTQAQPTWPSNALVANLTMTFSILLIAVVGLAAVFSVVLWRHRQHQKAKEGWTLYESWLRIWKGVSVIAVWLNVAAAILVGFLLIFQLTGSSPMWLRLILLAVLALWAVISFARRLSLKHIAVWASAILVGLLLIVQLTGFSLMSSTIFLLAVLALCAAISSARWLNRKHIAVWAASILVCAFVIVQITNWGWGWTISTWKGWAETLSKFDQNTVLRLLVGAVWGALVIASYFLRKLLVQYVGDVVAYVSAHEASKFCEIRTAIHKTALNVAKTIYAAKNDGAFLYERIVVVGHSLGSVVAYDTLNAVILGDRLGEANLNAVERTKMFLTFGSPLDKTAYIFRNHTAIEAEVRERLSAEVQPMIRDYKYRPAKWVNLYSHHDWISGALEYYDDRSQTQHKEKFIDNVIDRYACIHVMAHTQYWAGYQFAIHLYEGVTGKTAVKLRKEEADPGLVKSEATAQAKMDVLPEPQS